MQERMTETEIDLFVLILKMNLIFFLLLMRLSLSIYSKKKKIVSCVPMTVVDLYEKKKYDFFYFSVVRSRCSSSSFDYKKKFF